MSSVNTNTNKTTNKSGPSASAIQHGRRKGTARDIHGAGVKFTPSSPAASRKAAVLPTVQGRKIQDNVTKHPTTSPATTSHKRSAGSASAIRKGTTVRDNNGAGVKVTPRPPVDLRKAAVLPPVSGRKIQDKASHSTSSSAKTPYKTSGVSAPVVQKDQRKGTTAVRDVSGVKVTPSSPVVQRKATVTSSVSGRKIQASHPASSSASTPKKMAGVSASVVQKGQRNEGTPAVRDISGVKSTPRSHVDLRKAVVLPPVKGRKLQDKANTEASSNNKFSAAKAPVVDRVRGKKTFRKDVSTSGVINKQYTERDLDEVAVLSASDWERIQDSMKGVNREQERLLAANKQREDLYKRSQEATKDWTDTFAKIEQRKIDNYLMGKVLREEKRKQLDREEAEFRAQERKVKIDKARTLQFYQTDRVKNFHSALLHKDVINERKAQIELKTRKRKAAKDLENEFNAMVKRNEEKALEQERLNVLARKQKVLATAETWKQQVKERDQAREERKTEQKKERQELVRADEADIKEQAALKQRQRERTRDFKTKAYREDLARKEAIRQAAVTRDQQEESRRERFLEAQEVTLTSRKEKAAQAFQQGQRRRDALGEELAAHKEAQVIKQEQLLSKALKAAAEAQAKKEKQEREEIKIKAAELKDVLDHRDGVRNERKRAREQEKQNVVDMQNAKDTSYSTFCQAQQTKADKRAEATKIQHDAWVHQMEERQVKRQHVKNVETEFAARNAAIIARDDDRFQNYVEEEIQKAGATRESNMLVLNRSANQGMRGELGVGFRGVRPRCDVLDQSQFQHYKHPFSTVRGVKLLTEPANIQEAKDQLGFAWEL